MTDEKKAKVLLIHPNDQRAVYGDTLRYAACEPPYWCAVAASFCMAHDIETKIYDAEAENVSFDEVAEAVLNYEPDLIGVFVTGTNLSASTQKMQGTDFTVKVIKNTGIKVPVFLWGLHPSALPERSLEESEADYVVTGEGYDTIVNLAKFHAGIVKNFSEELLGGLCFTKEGQFVRFGFSKLLDTSQLPMPAWELLPMKKYMPHNWHIMGEDRPEDAKGRYGVVSTSIGCPYQCSYCAISSLFGQRKLRYWDSDRVVVEIERLVKDYNVKYIKILDECFVLNKKYVTELCKKIKEKAFDINMWAYARIDTVDEEILEELGNAGIKWLAYGIESADDDVLAEVSKSQYTSEKTRMGIQQTKAAGINVLANFMFGLPDDTKESMEKSLAFCREINPEWINFYVTMTYPGSPDYFEGVKAGKISNDKWIEYAQYSYECVPAGGKYLTPKEVLEFRDYAFNAFFEGNNRYFDMISQKFGKKYADDIKKMTTKRLRRKLLGD